VLGYGRREPTTARYVSIHHRSTHKREAGIGFGRHNVKGAPWNLTEIKVIAALPSLFSLQATYECGMVT